VVVRRKSGKKAEAIFHYFGGAIETKASIQIMDDEMKIVAREHNAAGAPLEWIEVNVS